MAAPTQFDIARQRAQQQSRAGLQRQQEALKRRFASMGATSSGAALKQQQIAEQAAGEQLQGAEEQIGAAEQQEAQRKAEIEAERTYQAGEAEKGRQFQTGEAEKARQFAIQERQAGETFQAEQAKLTRALQERAQAFAETSEGRQYELAMKEFGENLKSADLQRRIAVGQAMQEGLTPEQLGLRVTSGETGVEGTVSKDVAARNWFKNQYNPLKGKKASQRSLNRYLGVKGRPGVETDATT